MLLRHFLSFLIFNFFFLLLKNDFSEICGIFFLIQK